MIAGGRTVTMDGVTTPDAAPPVYLPYPQPPPPPAPKPWVRRTLLAVAAGWALLLVATGVWYSWHGKPTDREQTTIAAAAPVVDQALTYVVRAAGRSVVPALFGYDKIEDCSVTPIRRGALYERAVLFYTPVGSEPALLDRIAAGLPSGYHPVVRHATGGGGGGVHTLTADAGVVVRTQDVWAAPDGRAAFHSAGLGGPGAVTWTVTSGSC
jgi:hypothetical protein